MILKTASKTDVIKLSGAVVASLKNEGSVIVEAMGPTALNIATKAIILARTLLASNQMDLYMVPSFSTVPDAKDPNTMKTLIKLKVTAC